MTRAEQSFPLLLAGSLAVHAVVVVFLALGGGGSGRHVSQVQVYSVQIVEAPAPPSARVLTLEPPVNRPEAIAIPPSASPAPPKALPPGLAVPQGKAPRLPMPAPLAPGEVQVSPTQPQALPPPGAPEATLPSLPADLQQSKPESPAKARPRGAEQVSPEAAAPTLPAPVRPMDRLRNKVEHMKLQVDAPPAPLPDSTAPDQDSGMGLRLFHNAVRERVQKNYSFPGTFSRALKARVRVVVARDGTQLSAEIVQPSGDPRFDNLVCLAAIRNSHLPPIPESIQGDSVTVTLTCSP